MCQRSIVHGTPVAPHTMRRPWTVTLDFRSEKRLKSFLESFDNQIVQLDDKVVMKMHFIEVHGPVESDWFQAFYGESRVKGARNCGHTPKSG